jgi:hypothetical protein
LPSQKLRRAVLYLPCAPHLSSSVSPLLSGQRCPRRISSSYSSNTPSPTPSFPPPPPSFLNAIWFKRNSLSSVSLLPSCYLDTPLLKLSQTVSPPPRPPAIWTPQELS